MIQERILKIMTNYGLNAGQFADKLGVQPSSISHILSGRNKPSLDFITKLLNNFPQIDYMWLVMGKGSMMKINTEKEDLKENFKEIKSSDNNSSELNLFSNENTQKTINKPSEISKIESNVQDNKNKSLQNVKQIKNNSTNIESSLTKDIENKDEFSKQDTSILKSIIDEKTTDFKIKTISKIIVFYSDNTFDELVKKQ